MTIFRTGAVVAAMLVMIPVSAAAQAVSENRVERITAWSVFVEEEPKECWVVSEPVNTVNTRDGEEVEVRRGDMLLFVTYRPESGVEGEVSFTGGYPYREGSTVRLQVGDNGYDLITDGEWAWPASPEEDAQVVEVLKAGTEAVLTGVSSRGTTTRDTFSLIGITEALAEAEKRCQ